MRTLAPFKEISLKESTQPPAPNSGGSENQSPQNLGFRGCGMGNFLPETA